MHHPNATAAATPPTHAMNPTIVERSQTDARISAKDIGAPITIAAILDAKTERGSTMAYANKVRILLLSALGITSWENTRRVLGRVLLPGCVRFSVVFLPSAGWCKNECQQHDHNQDDNPYPLFPGEFALNVFSVFFFG